MSRLYKLAISLNVLLIGMLFNLPLIYANPIHVAENLQQKLPLLIQQAGIPGISIAYIESGKIQWLSANGLSNAEKTNPVLNDTVFEAASLSKPVLAYIVLKMVEAKQLSLDTPLHTVYLEPRLSQKDYAKLLTPRLILSHQTGLPNWGGDQLKFNLQPGTAFGYSGEGYVYLQKVLEKITGLSFQDLANREVFTPLKMHNSRFTWSDQDKFQLATGHNQASKPVSREIPNANAASSLHTTAADYAKFIVAWLQLTGISEESVIQAFKPTISLPEKHGAPIDTANKNPANSVLSWGLGWGLMQKDKQKVAWHWGDNGVFRAFTAINLSSKSAIVYFTNSQNGLAIAEVITKLSIADPTPIINWLGYGQSHSPIWQGMLKGYVAESENDFGTAIKQFKKVLQAFPDNQSIRHRIDWLTSLQQSSGNKISLSKLELQQIVGRYEVRFITLKNNQLYYRRDGGNEHLLKPISKDLFSVGDIFEFRLQTIRDKNGKVTKLVGHYINGFKDESPRSN